MSCVFQNLAGLQNRYPQNLWQEILGNCDVQLFLGCTDPLTAEFVSSRTGLASVAVTSKATKAREPKAGGSKAQEPKAKAAKAEAPKAGTPKEMDSRTKTPESGQKKGEKKGPAPKAGGQAGIVVTDKESIMS